MQPGSIIAVAAAAAPWNKSATTHSDHDGSAVLFSAVRVDKVELIYERGYYLPATQAGLLLVDGIVAPAFTSTRFDLSWLTPEPQPWGSPINPSSLPANKRVDLSPINELYRILTSPRWMQHLPHQTIGTLGAHAACVWHACCLLVLVARRRPRTSAPNLLRISKHHHIVIPSQYDVGPGPGPLLI